LAAKPSQWPPGDGTARPDPDRPAPDPAARRVEVSVVIPVFNEESCIEPLWERLEPVLRGLGRTWEVLFVDDGSTDAGPGILACLRGDNRSVRLIRLLRNQGQSAALDAGFRAARGGWILTLDADLQNPPEEIPRLFEAADGVELVFGRRRRRRDSWFKRIGSRIGNSVRNLITGHRVRDTGCSLKLYRAGALHRFLPTLFVFYGYRIREVEVDHHPRVSGTSKYGNLKRAWHGLADCFAVRWMRRRSLDYRVEEIGTDENPT
jgi:glycosyltransferase involved in cell wall biosynthesis